jgi:sulfite reductase (NADPH) hemoprotein beta-component
MATEAKPTHNEIIKDNSPTLAGSIAQTMADPEADRFDKDDQQFIKFHGIYQQDDRDNRKGGKKFMFMVRGRIPGGILSPDLYLAYDNLADKYGNQTLRITSRQSFQFHGIIKEGLGKVIKGINDAMADTLAACGDVNRNVMSPPTPATNSLREAALEDCRKVAAALLPITPSYVDIWVEGVKLDLNEKHEGFVDPLYGKTYLPRKFKTAFAIPPLNDTDVFTNCLGFIAIEENGELVGYNLVVGGGQGRTHNNIKTYPRTGDVIGFFTPEKIVEVSKAVLTVHRDFGDRCDRKHARLKYVLEEKGADWFRGELETRTGVKLDPARDYTFESQGDLFGWHEQLGDKLFLGLHVSSGRIKNVEGYQLKAALRKIVDQFRPEARLTPSQNIVLTGIDPANKDAITQILADHGVPVENQSTALQRASMACPALPTCGLALAESERYLPDLIDQIGAALSDAGLPDEEIVIRMTGCPNGCARPYMAELGFVGKSPKKYQIYLGGNETSTRLNTLWKDTVLEDEIIAELTPLFVRFKAERENGERFGDYCARVILPEHAAAIAESN